MCDHRHFTRCVKLLNSPEATGKNTAENLLQHFGRFGAPRKPVRRLENSSLTPEISIGWVKDTIWLSYDACTTAKLYL
jgi:hypothetical protein